MALSDPNDFVARVNYQFQKARAEKAEAEVKRLRLELDVYRGAMRPVDREWARLHLKKITAVDEERNA